MIGDEMYPEKGAYGTSLKGLLDIGKAERASAHKKNAAFNRPAYQYTSLEKLNSPRKTLKEAAREAFLQSQNEN